MLGRDEESTTLCRVERVRRGFGAGEMADQADGADRSDAFMVIFELGKR